MKIATAMKLLLIHRRLAKIKGQIYLPTPAERFRDGILQYSQMGRFNSSDKR